MRQALRTLGNARGMTLIEVISALAIAAVITGSLHLLLGATVRGRMIAQARVSDQERGRVAMASLSERVRQILYDESHPEAACREGFVRIGSGDGFSERLAFRAVLDRTAGRRTYVYYLEGRVLWEERLEECAGDGVRSSPIALTPPVVQALRFAYFLPDGSQVPEAAAPVEMRQIQWVRITMTLEAPSALGRPPEVQTYQTAAAVRAP